MVGGNQQSMLARLTPDGKQIVYLEYRLALRSLRRPIACYVLLSPVDLPDVVLEGRGFSNLQCARLPSTLCLYSQVE